MSATDRTRPMSRNDVAAVGALFMRAFRGHSADTADDFQRYYRDIFFDNPAYSEAHGGVVGLSPKGDISSAISVLPMRFAIGEQEFTARMVCAFAADPESSDSMAGRLAIGLFPRSNDLCFTDTGSLVSSQMAMAGGAQVLPIQSLDFHLPFRRAQSLALHIAKRFAPRLAPVLRTLAAPIDWLIGPPRGVKHPKNWSRAKIEPCTTEEFVAEAPRLVERFALHPTWEQNELTWLIDKARENTALGALNLFKVIGINGTIVGVVAAYVPRRGSATILNIACTRNSEGMVVKALMDHLREAGLAGAEGMAQPFLMAALCAQPGLRLRPRGYFLASSRIDAVNEAIIRNDVYIGGLAGEGWSRLLTDW